MRQWSGPVHVSIDDFPALDPVQVREATHRLADAAVANRIMQWEALSGHVWEPAASQWEELAEDAWGSASGVLISTTRT